MYLCMWATSKSLRYRSYEITPMMSLWCHRGALQIYKRKTASHAEVWSLKLGRFPQYNKVMLLSCIMGNVGSSVFGAWFIRGSLCCFDADHLFFKNLFLTSPTTFWKCITKLQEFPCNSSQICPITQMQFVCWCVCCLFHPEKVINEIS